MISDGQLNQIVATAVPLIRDLATGRYAIALAGSRGKAMSDTLSDVDFRLYRETQPPEAELTVAEGNLQAAIETWRQQGVEVDGCWTREIAEVDRKLAASLTGYPEPEPIVWTVSGYHLLTDLMNQQAIDDPDGIIAGWRRQLQTYPTDLKRAIIDRHWQSLTYWRDDYHYRNKVNREDAIFLAGLTTTLVHDLIQVVFALNETYYPGDGNNARYLARFERKPPNLEERLHAALYPTSGSHVYRRQRAVLLELIDDLVAFFPAGCTS